MQKKPKRAAAEILQVLNSKVIPWAEQGDTARIIVAQPTLKKFLDFAGELPPDVTVKRKKLLGPKVHLKGPLASSSYRSTNVRWPKDGLDAKLLPMVVCVVSGSTDLHLGEYIVHCPEGCFIIIPADIPSPDGTRPHLENQSEDAYCDLLWITPVLDLLHCWICHSEGKRHWRAGENDCFLRQKQVNTYFADLVQEITERKSGYERIYSALLLALLGSMERELLAGNYFHGAPQSPRALTSEEEKDPIKRAQNYIRSNITRPLTIAQVARAVYMSRSHFAKRFHEETGKTFTEFLTQCRVEEAQNLLRNSPITIISICWHIGIKPSRLLQIFNRDVGMSPSAYRQSFAQTAEADDSGAR